MDFENSKITRREALKRAGAAALAVSTAGGLAASASARSNRSARRQSDSVNYYSYSVYTAPEYFKAFTHETGIKVTTGNYGGEPELLSKLRATRGRGFDVMNVNNALVQQLAAEGLIQPIDPTRLKNWKYVYPRFQDADFLQDKGKFWGSPGVWGPDGIVYRTDKVKGIDSWSALWDEKLKGKLTNVDDGYEEMLIAGVHLGMKAKFSKNPIRLTDADYAKLKSALIDQVRLDTKLWADNATAEALIASGDAVVSLGRIALLTDLRKQNIPVKLINPKEGALGWANGSCISVASTNIDNAYKFLDYLISPDYGVALANKYGYPSPSARSMAALAPAFRKDLFMNDPDLLDKLLFWQPAADRAKWDQLWTEVKAAA